MVGKCQSLIWRYSIHEFLIIIHVLPVLRSFQVIAHYCLLMKNKGPRDTDHTHFGVICHA